MACLSAGVCPQWYLPAALKRNIREFGAVTEDIMWCFCQRPLCSVFKFGNKRAILISSPFSCLPLSLTMLRQSSACACVAFHSCGREPSNGWGQDEKKKIKKGLILVLPYLYLLTVRSSTVEPIHTCCGHPLTSLSNSMLGAVIWFLIAATVTIIRPRLHATPAECVSRTLIP